jgi:hypothetical protein
MSGSPSTTVPPPPTNTTLPPPLATTAALVVSTSPLPIAPAAASSLVFTPEQMTAAILQLSNAFAVMQTSLAGIQSYLAAMPMQPPPPPPPSTTVATLPASYSDSIFYS